MKDLCNVIPGMTEDMTPGSLRIGATNAMINNEHVELVHAVCRGGWDFTGLCNIFNYIQASQALLTVGGQALAGWPFPRKRAYPPRLIFRTPDTVDKLDNIISDLFNYPSGKGFQPGGHLHPLMEVMLATIVKSYDSMVDDHGKKNPLIAKILEVCAPYRVDHAVLSEWCKEVNMDWTLRNHEQRTGGQSGPDGASITTQFLLQHIQTQSVEMGRLNRVVLELREELKLSNKTQQQILAMLKTLNNATISVSPTRKPRVTNSQSSAHMSSSSSSSSMCMGDSWSGLSLLDNTSPDILSSLFDDDELHTMDVTETQDNVTSSQDSSTTTTTTTTTTTKPSDFFTILGDKSKQRSLYVLADKYNFWEFVKDWYTKGLDHKSRWLPDNKGGVRDYERGVQCIAWAMDTGCISTAQLAVLTAAEPDRFIGTAFRTWNDDLNVISKAVELKFKEKLASQEEEARDKSVPAVKERQKASTLTAYDGRLSKLKKRQGERHTIIIPSRFTI
eukprot:gene23774-30038_t